MATTTINLTVRVDGSLVDLTTAQFKDSSSGVYGIRLASDDSIVVASGVTIPNVGTGLYQYVTTALTEDAAYDVGFALTYQSVTRYYIRTITGGSTVNQSYLIPTVNHFSSEAEVTRLLGSFGVGQALEDWNTDDRHSVWEDLLISADTQVALHINQYYNPTTNLLNPYLRRVATYFSAWEISKRRGNPGLYQQEVLELKDQLEGVRTRKFIIPDGIPIGNTGPVVRNYIMQPHSPFPMRVEKLKSMGDSYVGEKTSLLLPYFYCY